VSERDDYPVGVPCWVETLQPDPAAALTFYGALFGWEFSEPAPMAGGLPGEYFVASVGGRDVAGIGALAAVGGPSSAVWGTCVRVASADDAVARATEAGAGLLIGPLDAGPAGRLAVLVDPTGAVFEVWEAGDRKGAQVVNEPGTWLMSSLHTPDPAAAAAFYGELFGWRAQPLAPGVPVTLFCLDGHVGGEPGQMIPRDAVAVMTPTAGDGVPPHWNVNLRVADADAVTARAESLGGSVLMAPTDAPGFRNAVLADPQGAAFSISQVLFAR
jgi:predicted enzyme related to lactoylglutathione lyase